MSNGVNFKDLRIDLRRQLDRVTAERDAALTEVERLKNIDHRQILVESAAKYFLDSGAENFIGDVFTIEADDGKTKFEVIVTTQKVGAKSPGELCNELQQRLTAADGRVDVLETRKGDLELSLMWLRSQLTDAVLIRFIDIALKPSEGCGDEYRKSCEVAHKALSMENQRIVVPGQFKCLACGDIHPGSGNLPCPKMLPTA